MTSHIIKSIVNSAIYGNIMSSIRDSLMSSESKEEIRERVRRFYKVFSPLILLNSPRNNPKKNVQDKLEFYLKHISPGYSVVDVGCFDGYYSQKLREYGCNVVGVDYLDLVVSKTRKEDPNGEYVVAFAEDLPFQDNSFDVGLYSHVFHHVFDPSATISEARRVIRQDGKIIVAVPKKLGTDPNHIRAYSKEDLVNLVSSEFKDIEYYESIGIGHGCIGFKR